MGDWKKSGLIALVGLPGTGKGTFGRALASALGWRRVVVGDLARAVPAFAERIARGELLSDAEIAPLVRTALAGGPAVLDGFPRSPAQVAELPPGAAVRIAVPSWALRRILAGRRECRLCGAECNVTAIDEAGLDLPALPGPRPCCRLPGALRTRPDDAPEVVEKRLAEGQAREEAILKALQERPDITMFAFNPKRGVRDIPQLLEMLGIEAT